MGIPETLAWADVLTGVGEFLGNALVSAAIVAVLGLGFGKKLVRALRGIIGGRA